jgi:hypothetical protein
VAESRLGINEIVDKTEYLLEKNWSSNPNYEFIVMGRNKRGFSERRTVKCSRKIG